MYGMLLPEAINNPILSVFQLFGLVLWEYINIALTERLWLVKQVLEFVYGLWELGQIFIAAAGEAKISKGVWRRGVQQSSDLGLLGHPLWRKGLQCLFVGWGWPDKMQPSLGLSLQTDTAAPSSVPGHTHPLEIVNMPEPELAHAWAGALNRGAAMCVCRLSPSQGCILPGHLFPNWRKVQSSKLALAWENCSWVGKIKTIKRIDAQLMFVQSRFIIQELCRLWLPDRHCSSPLQFLGIHIQLNIVNMPELGLAYTQGAATCVCGLSSSQGHMRQRSKMVCRWGIHQAIHFQIEEVQRAQNYY